MNTYSVSYSIVYRHTYEFMPADEFDNEPAPCGQEGCACTGEENPLTSAEVDEFMRDIIYSDRPRYVWYANIVLPYDNVTDITCADGGVITCKVVTKKSLEEIAEELANYREVFYDSGPGSEAVVPTMHEYSYTAMCTGVTGYTENERGRIDIDIDTIEISNA
jgi:hypothetical protein